jgi:hypothetical protein
VHHIYYFSFFRFYNANHLHSTAMKNQNQTAQIFPNKHRRIPTQHEHSTVTHALFETTIPESNEWTEKAGSQRRRRNIRGKVAGANFVVFDK